MPQEIEDRSDAVTALGTRHRESSGFKRTAVLLLALSMAALGGDLSALGNPPQWSPIGKVTSKRLRELSGICKSRAHPGIYWVQNDSGNAPSLFAIKLNGEVVAEIPVQGAKNQDWEDIAIDLERGLIYIADIGDNGATRKSYQLYELPEPDPFAVPIQPVVPSRVLKYQLPDGPANGEALFIRGGALFLITKETRDRPIIYRLGAMSDDALEPVRVGTVGLGPVTGADVSVDGSRLAVCSYGQLAVFDVSEGVTGVGESLPQRITYSLKLQTEGCCFDGRDVILTIEAGRLWRISPEDFKARRHFP